MRPWTRRDPPCGRSSDRLELEPNEENLGASPDAGLARQRPLTPLSPDSPRSADLRTHGRWKPAPRKFFASILWHLRHNLGHFFKVDISPPWDLEPRPNPGPAQGHPIGQSPLNITAISAKCASLFLAKVLRTGPHVATD